MPNKVIKTDKSVSVRIDNVYVTNAKHFIEPYIRDGEERFFGEVKFRNPNEAKATLKEAIKQLGAGVQDTIFGGQYPKWIEDNYGNALKLSGRLKFATDLTGTEEVSPLSIKDFNFSLELSLFATKKNEVFLLPVRAIVIARNEYAGNDDLFNDDTSADITDADLPF